MTRLQNGINVIERATNEDRKKNYSRAFDLYHTGIEHFLYAIKHELTSERKKNLLRQKCNEFIQRAEEIKKFIKETPPPPYTPRPNYNPLPPLQPNPPNFENEENLTIREVRQNTKQCRLCQMKFDSDEHKMAIIQDCCHVFGESCLRKYVLEKLRCPDCHAKCTSRDVKALLFG